MKKKHYTSYVREIVITYKTLETEKIQLSNPLQVYDFLRDKIGFQVKEHFVVLGINNKNVVNTYHQVSIGTVTESIVHPREVFQPAVLASCSGIIISHNHPSGVLEPSRQDIETTKRLIEAGKVMGIPLVDHIIISNESYYSLKENGYII